MIEKKNSQNDTILNLSSENGGFKMFYGALPIHFELAKKLRENQTVAEIFLWNHLQKKIQIRGVRFKRQHPIMYFIADF